MVAHVKGLIADLAQIDALRLETLPRHGLLVRLSRRWPVSTVASWPRGNPVPAPSFIELVKLGPTALPYFARGRSTILRPPGSCWKVLASPGGRRAGFSSMYRINEISGNPVNAAEQAALGPPPDPAPDNLVAGQRHVVTIGDICFVVIGQIVGRPDYRVARYRSNAETTSSTALRTTRRSCDRCVRSGRRPIPRSTCSIRAAGFFHGGRHRSDPGILVQVYPGRYVNLAALAPALRYFPG